jgi:uncharacterized protein
MQPIVACPACKRKIPYSTSNPARPFCSMRCKSLDLGAWASEAYKISGSPLEAPGSDHPGEDMQPADRAIRVPRE